MRMPHWTQDPDPWLITLVTLGVVGSGGTVLLAYAPPTTRRISNREEEG